MHQRCALCTRPCARAAIPICSVISELHCTRSAAQSARGWLASARSPVQAAPRSAPARIADPSRLGGGHADVRRRRAARYSALAASPDNIEVEASCGSKL